MTKLLLIADDITGALDAAAQFAAFGACVSLGGAAQSAQVLAIDAATRHLQAEDAYARVYALTSAAPDVPYIYKKTDSLLRGNIGAELHALCDAAGACFIPFLPSYPQNGRVTRAGVQYLHGVPIDQTALAADPFHPIRTGVIAELLQGCGMAVHNLGKNAAPPYPDGIGVLDAETDAELLSLGKALFEQGQLRLSAGCAGFAGALAQCLPLERCEIKQAQSGRGVLLLCGSVSPASLLQMQRLRALGHELLLPDKDYLYGRTARFAPAQSLEAALRARGFAAVATVREASEVEPGLRERTAESLAAIAQRAVEKGLADTLVIFGGDTLRAVLERLGLAALQVQREIAPGVIESRAAGLRIVSKSGGFGAPALMDRLLGYLGVCCF